MKYTTLLLFLLLSLSLVLAGCSKTPKAKLEADKFGTNRLETAFAIADPPVKTALQNTETAINAEDYGRAYDLLQGLLKINSLSQEQTDAVNSSMKTLATFPRRAP